MLTILGKLMQLLPCFGRLWEKISAANNSRVEEIRAATEQADIRGFHRTGRISASHAWKYAKLVLALLVTLCFLALCFLPPLGQSPLDLLPALESALGILARLFALGL